MTLIRGVCIITVLAVGIGLIFAVLEWRHMRWLLQTVRARRINGLRQMMVVGFLREAFLRLMIQGILLMPALFALSVASHAAGVPVSTAAVLAALSYLAVTVLLTWKAWIVRRDRLAVSDMLAADDLYNCAHCEKRA